MSVYNDIITEIYTRLTTAQAEDEPLELVKSVYVGTRKNVQSINDLPVITIEVTGLNESGYAICGGGGFIGTLDLDLVVHYGLPAERDSNIYSGIIGLVEAIGNVVYCDIDGNLDPTLGGKCTESFSLRGGAIEKLNEVELMTVISLSFKSKLFGRKGR